jgi:hypothetical protein
MFEPGDIAHPAAGPVAEGEAGGAAKRTVALHERAEDVALVAGQLAGCEEWLGGERHTAHGVTLKQALFLDKPTSEAVEHRLAPGPVTHTQPLLL